MDEKNKVVLFGQENIRREWHNNQWYLSIIDVIAALTNSSIPRRYWSDLKSKLKDEGS